MEVFFDVDDQFFLHGEHHDMVVFLKYGVMMDFDDLLVADQCAKYYAGRKMDGIDAFAYHRMGFAIDMGNDAVMVFFVLSGFVIAYTVDRGETRASDYALARLVRMYSLALPAGELGRVAIAQSLKLHQF